MRKKEVVRFAIGSPSSARSSVWAVKRSGNDVYVMQSGMGGVTKYSFHDKLICRSAITKDYARASGIARDVAHEWQRGPTPPQGANQGSRVLWIMFPTDYLSTAPGDDELLKRKSIIWIDAAPEGSAISIEMYFTLERQATVQSTDNGRTVIYLTLPNGEAFGVRATSVPDWVNEDVSVPPALDVGYEYRFLANDPLGPTRPIRFSMARLSADGQAVLLRELGGHKVPASAAGFAVDGARHGNMTRTRIVARVPPAT